MDILTESQHRALAFIEACNSQGYAPKAPEIETWLREPPVPQPTHARHRLMSPSAVTQKLGGGRVSDQLVELRWAYVDGGRLYLHPLGRALLGDADAKTAEASATTTVVLGADNPLSYAALMSELAAAGAGLLIDPYIRREQLMHIVQDTGLTRLLVSRKVGDNEIAALRSFLGYVPEQRGLEVRVASEAHDRYLKTDDGRLFIIGTSMDMVPLQRATTVFTPVPEDGRRQIDDLVEGQWAGGEWLRSESELPAPEPTDGDL